MTKTLKTKLSIRKDSTNGWALNDPILLLGELGYDYQTKRLKIGNGIDKWTNLINDVRVYSSDYCTTAQNAISAQVSGGSYGILNNDDTQLLAYDDIVTLQGNQNLTNKTYEGYLLNDACEATIGNQLVPLVVSTKRVAPEFHVHRLQFIGEDSGVLYDSQWGVIEDSSVPLKLTSSTGGRYVYIGNALKYGYSNHILLADYTSNYAVLYPGTTANYCFKPITLYVRRSVTSDGYLYIGLAKLISIYNNTTPVVTVNGTNILLCNTSGLTTGSCQWIRLSLKATSVTKIELMLFNKVGLNASYAGFDLCITT